MLCDGVSVGYLERSHPAKVELATHGCHQLDIVVHAMGRNSAGTEFDLKGLVEPDVRVNGVQ